MSFRIAKVENLTISCVDKRLAWPESHTIMANEQIFIKFCLSVVFRFFLFLDLKMFYLSSVLLKFSIYVLLT